MNCSGTKLQPSLGGKLDFSALDWDRATPHFMGTQEKSIENKCLKRFSGVKRLRATRLAPMRSDNKNGE